MPKIILLGGAPKSGKSTIARCIAERLACDLVCTDDLGLAVRSLTTPESHPDLHPMARVDYHDYYLERSVAQLWHQALRAHRALWLAIVEVIRARVAWGRPAVVEGWALLPELVAGLGLEEVAALWILVIG